MSSRTSFLKLKIEISSPLLNDYNEKLTKQKHITYTIIYRVCLKDGLKPIVYYEINAAGPMCTNRLSVISFNEGKC